ncbi:MAG: hypothetical protein GXX86_02205, partial [Propionibacterium sp.]|nr:hypothetical protein [Propionibacterium sp.]
PTPRRRWQGVAVAAVAALVVGGVAAGTWALSPGEAVNAPAPQPAQEPGDPAPQPAGGPDEAWDGVQHEVSAAAIPTIPQDKYLYVQCVSDQDGLGTMRREYIAADGWQWVWQTHRTGDGNSDFYLLIDPADSAQYLESLPTEPSELMNHLLSGYGGNSNTERAFSTASDIVLTEMVGAERGAALMAALAMLTADEGRTITVEEVTVDGVPATSVRVDVAAGSPDLSGKGEEVAAKSQSMTVGKDGRMLAAGSSHDTGTEQGTYQSTCRRTLVDEIDPHLANTLGLEKVAKEVG